MTVQEFSNEFDLLYDNASKGAPGLDLYEKSVFLTKAQDDIIKEVYSGYTPSRVPFEGSEKRRRQLSELVRDYRTETTLDGYVNEHIAEGTQFFGLPTDLMYILQERVTFTSVDKNINNSIVSVKPITHDEYNFQIDNPFKKPSKRTVWRLDLYRAGSGQQVEIIAFEEIKEYHIRYIKRPRPIILTNFESDDDLAGLGLTIDSENTAQTSELNEEIHRDILGRSIELAIMAARENNLINKIKSNKTTI